MPQQAKKTQPLTFMECLELMHFLRENVDKVEPIYRYTKNGRWICNSQGERLIQGWKQFFYKERKLEGDHNRFRKFSEHVVEVIRVLNQEMQDQPGLFSEMITDHELFLDNVHLCLVDPEVDPLIKRNLFEPGFPHLGLCHLWSVERFLEDESLRVPGGYKSLFNETGEWFYKEESGVTRLLFRPYSNGRITFPVSSNPYTPWAGLLSWGRGANQTRSLDKMIVFLKRLPESYFVVSEDEEGYTEGAYIKNIFDDTKKYAKRPLLSKPGRTLCYFVLSELNLHPNKTGGPDFKEAQRYVDLIAEEHPLGLFDAQLPTPVLQHCGEIRLQAIRLQKPLLFKSSLENSSTEKSCWEQKEFLEIAPQLFPALHALLHAAARPTEATLNSPTEDYVKLLLQAFHPGFFAGNKEETLSAPDSLLGKICFTLLPRCIEHFMHADRLIKKQIQEISEQNPPGEVINSIQENLTRHREALARLISEDIHRLLSHPQQEMSEEAVEGWLQAQETNLRQKLLAHALESPNVILKAEENRLNGSLTPTERAAPDNPQLKAIAVLRDGQRQIQALNQQCIENKIEPTEYTKRVQTVLKRVREEGGKHSHSLTVVGRIAANVSIVLTFGLMYHLLKTDIQKTHVTPATGWGRFFFSLNSRRAATVQCIEQAQSAFRSTR